MVLISQAEAVAILGLTPAAFNYIALVRRQLTPAPAQARLLYSLAEVHRLAQPCAEGTPRSPAARLSVTASRHAAADIADRTTWSRGSFEP